LKKDNSKLISSDVVSVCENAFAAVFESLEVQINGSIVSKSAALYPYKAHIFDLLTKSSAYKAKFLSSNQLFEPESKPDVFTASDNEGFSKRLTYTKESKYVEMSGVKVSLASVGTSLIRLT
jgi:hypothetical protein